MWCTGDIHGSRVRYPVLGIIGNGKKIYSSTDDGTASKHGRIEKIESVSDTTDFFFRNGQ